MKKNRILSVGILAAAALVLSACTVTVGGPALTNKEIRTSWIILADNEYVVCQNDDTRYEVRFDDPSIANRVGYADVTIRGEAMGNYSVRIDLSNAGSDAEHDYVFDFALPSELRPYPMSDSDSLNPAAIVPTPIPPEVIPAVGGSQSVIVTVRDPRGNRLDTITGNFDVWTACSL